VDLKPGVRLDPPTSYDWSKQPSTLVMAVCKDCMYCEQSIPLYQRLAAQERERHLSVDLLATICKVRGHSFERFAHRWTKCKWCGTWLREVRTIEEREDEPPEDEQSPILKLKPR